ncbi:SRPBCC family protein [Mycobacterium spongiae]|uniref:SRPBCC family protein n=1 Tax=Mycobacterium spongiae TaxID=886343 RepID=UPI001BAC0252|nr:SRPBCC family protein [Mycobacterium spongiae]
MSRPALSIHETIAAAPDEVWAALTDWDNAHLWMPGIEWMRAHGDTAAGTVIGFRARGRDREAVIASLHPGRSLVLRSTQGGVTADYHYELRHIDDHTTRVGLRATCRTQGPVWAALSPVLRLAMRRADRCQLARLKLVAEAGAR